MYVAPGLPCDSVLLAASEQYEAVLRVSDDVFGLTLDEDASVLVLTNVQCLRALPVLEQVEQFLVVNLQERAVSGILYTAGSLDLAKACKQVLNGPRDNAVLPLICQKVLSTICRLLRLEARI